VSDLGRYASLVILNWPKRIFTTQRPQHAGDEQTEGEIQVKGDDEKKEKINAEEANR
jgi:hypothetical protein